MPFVCVYVYESVMVCFCSVIDSSEGNVNNIIQPDQSSSIVCSQFKTYQFL